ncbi:MAG: hypothetical protein ABSA26_00020 [Thermoguttaceae bacterium]|jgi:hypothetical protein
MITRITKLVLAVFFCAISASAMENATPIDRHALVVRHNIVLDKADPQTALQVGNGEFAFGLDLTGLQTFYGNTMSHWGWHTFPMPAGKRIEDFKLTEFDTYGRAVGYATNGKGQEELYRWLRENPHRFNLGRIALRLVASDGKSATLDQIRNPRQELDLWQGLIESRFEFDGQAVRVETCAHPDCDAVAVHIESPLIADGRLTVELAFPYGSPSSSGADWKKPDAHITHMTQSDRQADFDRQLDNDRYAVRLTWAGRATLKEDKAHTYILAPGKDEGTLEFVCRFAPEKIAGDRPTFAETKSAGAAHWAQFWRSGGAIDLSASKDPRWKELERRIVLSQYLLAVQETGSLPPQESGLFNNSSAWNGKFHLEMHWWHGAHYALWDRWPLLERSLGWYRKILPSARDKAQQQGYRGARWPKMVGPEGRDSPSGIGPLLIWQQPHPIFYAELDYRLHPTREILEKWREIVEDTAEFMASFAVPDKESGQFVLGPPIKTVPEKIDSKTTRNPAFELCYWRVGLRMAQDWRERLGLARKPEWDKVLQNLAPLPQADGLYLQQEGMTDTYTKNNWEHPALIGTLGMLPGDGTDPTIMKATVRKVMSGWQWDRCWGWDFPMMAIAAARNGEPGLAIDALLHPSNKNIFNQAGLSAGGPFPYFPSNGGLLYAVAMMAAGWDGGPEDKNAPGFPHDGTWVVKWERLRRAP